MTRLSSLLLVLFACFPGVAVSDKPATLDELLQQVTQARAQASEANAERERRFEAEQGLQLERLDGVREALTSERGRSQALQQVFEDNEAQRAKLDAQFEGRAGGLRELFGIARQVAGDASALLRDSLVSTQFPDRSERLAAIADNKAVPTIADLEDLWIALQQEMTESGKVVTYRTRAIGADGNESERDVTRVGVFNAVSGGKFLLHLPETGGLQELPRQPSQRYRALAAQLDGASSGVVPMAVDPSRGSVLSLLVQVPDLVERIQQGRLVGYIIIGLAAVGLLLALERMLYLAVVGWRMKRQLKKEIPSPRNPLGRVLSVYRDNPGVDTETLELMIDESIVKDTPRLQRGLSAIKILAMIAPLLGLLGTVTGLIETFQAITLFGTGDPKLMAGGISQALVTTVLGLMVAIPLILFHSGLLGKSRQLVGILEQQSAGLIARHAERKSEHTVSA